MISGIRNHDILVCADSDGTVMDTMTSKHVHCFGPCLFQAFPLPESHREEILKEWNRLNLYSPSRGINRFQGLLAILEFCCKSYGMEFEGLEDFRLFVEKSPALSNPALEQWSKNALHRDCLERALKWSKLVNESIQSLPLGEEFPGVKSALKRLSSFADLLGVSSANPSAVHEEWSKRGLLPYFMDCACQDKGSKKDIILQGLELGYDPKKVVMLGDAVGDEKAAKACGVHFYPIIPSREVESWNKLEIEFAPLMEKGLYRDEKEEECIDEFHRFLEKGR